MYAAILALVTFLVIQVIDCVPSSRLETNTGNETGVPLFMGNLYNNVQSGKLTLNNVIHSNEAIDIRRYQRSFEAVFSDLGFGQKEILEKVTLRLNFLKDSKCSRMFSLQFIDGNTLQVFNRRNYVTKQHGVAIIPVSSSLKKFMKSSSNVNKTLLLRVVFHNSTLINTTLCSHDVIDDVGDAIYLVSHTKERDADKFRRDIKDNKLPSNSGTSLKRFQRSSLNTKCQNHQVYVNLTSSNSTIALPPGFWTSVCGKWHPTPLGADETYKFIANSIKKAVQKANVQNAKCCKPDSYSKIRILYSDNNKHVVLRNFDKIVVTKCACKP